MLQCWPWKGTVGVSWRCVASQMCPSPYRPRNPVSIDFGTAWTIFCSCASLSRRVWLWPGHSARSVLRGCAGHLLYCCTGLSNDSEKKKGKLDSELSHWNTLRWWLFLWVWCKYACHCLLREIFWWLWWSHYCDARTPSGLDRTFSVIIFVLCSEHLCTWPLSSSS